jgi:hypothetical protein
MKSAINFQLLPERQLWLISMCCEAFLATFIVVLFGVNDNLTLDASFPLASLLCHIENIKARGLRSSTRCISSTGNCELVDLSKPIEAS